MSTRSRLAILTYRGIPLWRDIRILRGLAQVVSTIVVLSLLFFFLANMLEAANQRGLALGYDFLDEAAGFPIAESVIDYEEADSFGHAFLVGVLNTLKVALVGIVLATILGVIVGIARLSSNWLVRNIASTYIEIIRNVPLLVILFFLYFAVFQKLPSVQESIVWPGPIYVNQRGIFFVWFDATPSFGFWLSTLVAGLVSAVGLWIGLSRYQFRTGRATYPVISAFLVVVALPIAGWILAGQAPLSLNVPSLEGFNFRGGLRFTPEFSALLTGLVIYTATFMAEIVRAGILAVSRGQVGAAEALGLTYVQRLRLVILPQALRVIVPPMISQYLNLTKNSSLAIAIGYPDLFAVGRIMINQAGRAVPIFGMIMGAYLLMSLTYAVIGNIYNRRIRFVER